MSYSRGDRFQKKRNIWKTPLKIYEKNSLRGEKYMQCIIYFIPYIYICRMKIVEKRVLFEKKKGKERETEEE